MFHGKELSRGRVEDTEERTTADMRWQRKQEMGLDSEHSEKTRGGRVFSGKVVEGIIYRQKE